MWTYMRGQNRKHINSKWWKEFMFEVDYYWDDWVRGPWIYVTRIFWERLGRAWDFAKKGWLNHDWDSHYIHELLLFKLKRMKHNFIHYGHHDPECENYKPKMKSLTLAIKLLERYCSIYPPYYSKSIDAHDKKWGKLETWTAPADKDEDGYIRTFSWNSKRKNANTDEEKEQEKKEFRKAMDNDHKRQERDIRLAYAIVAKYHRYWWD